MNISRRLLAPLAILALGLAPALSAAEVPAKSKNGFTVLLEVKVDENGVAEDAKVIRSDDTSSDHLLERTALDRARGIKLAPRLKDGKAVKYTVQAPFVFPVEDDEGPEAPDLIKPKLAHAIQPVYPAAEAAQGQLGAVILEIMIGPDGRVASVKTLRSSSPVFEKAATDAVAQWTFVPNPAGGSPAASRWRMSICFENDVRAVDWTWRIAPRPSLGNYTIVHRTQTAAAPAVVTPPEEKK